MNAQEFSFPDAVQSVRCLRERLLADRWRPHYHFVPPEGFFNDPNGLLYWNERYHLFYLARTPLPDSGGPKWVEVWDHASSPDLVHWIQHPPALKPADIASAPLGIWSGDAVENAPEPTLVYYVPGQGICVAISRDPDLDHWTPLPENPVIGLSSEEDEFCTFDPAGWYADGVYHLLVGNRSRAPGYDVADSTSLFTSTDLIRWKYSGPFYRSRREWTQEGTDCACPDFFPLGDRHMLLMHAHGPVYHTHYYLGKLDGARFQPEIHGKMSGPGAYFAAPETLLDNLGRRILFGWLREAAPMEEWMRCGWGSTLSLPRLLEPDARHDLRVSPVPELRQLRRRETALPPTKIDAGEERILDGIRGGVLELDFVIDPLDCRTCGIRFFLSPDGEEQTSLILDRGTNEVRAEFASSSRDNIGDYRAQCPDGALHHALPFRLASGEPWSLRVFLDRSVAEIFVNERACLTLRVYPCRDDSDRVAVFAEDSAIALQRARAWNLHRSNPL